MKCKFCEEKAEWNFKKEIPCCKKHYHRLYNYGDPYYKRKTNEVTFDGGTAYLKTKHGTVFSIDKEDYHKIKDSKWVENKAGYLVARKNNKVYRLSRVLMGMSSGDKNVVDHIDGNTLNNKKDNLRIVSQSQNCKNTSHSKKSKTKYPGISILPTGKYKARITVNRKRIHIGHFDNLEEAISARKEYENKYFGELSYSQSRKL